MTKVVVKSAVILYAEKPLDNTGIVVYLNKNYDTIQSGSDYRSVG